MKTIDLGHGHVALVDDDDFARLSSYRWYRQLASGIPYARRWMRDRKSIAMHREILECPVGFEIDHIDGNGLNNQKANLRVCKHSENMRNRRLHKNNTSGIKGVRFEADRGSWSARIQINGRRIRLGRFGSAEEAAVAYRAAAVKFHGEFVRL